MSWDPKFSVQLEELDSQHKYFFTILDQVETASKERANEQFPLLIEELLRYAKYHFRSEEALMDSYDYPDTAHRFEHDRLLSRAESMMNDAEFRPSSLRLFLYNWIVNHIDLSDRELAHFIMEKRRAAAYVPVVAPR